MSPDDRVRDRPRADVPEPAPGTLLAGRFELRQRLGEGAIGRVWSAFDRQLREEVAVKLLRPELATAPEVVARFEREVRLARRVTHPGVCRTHDQGRDERFGPFITMERLHGETLAERVRRHGPFPPREAARLISAIADALAAAHGAGVVHRDLKTANVMLVTADDGVQPVLTDFGLARSALVEAGDTATASGQVVGSPAYMAPEQVLGEAVGPGTDVYALGVIAFELLTGKLPFSAGSPLATAIQRLDREPPAPSTFSPGVAPGWDGPILRALARDPAVRQADPRELARSLTGAEGVETAPSRPDAGAASRWGRAVAVLAALALLLLPVLGFHTGGQSEARSLAHGLAVADEGEVAAVAAVEAAAVEATPPPAPEPAAVPAAEQAMAEGNELLRAGEPVAARPHYRRAARGFATAGDSGRRAAALNNLANSFAMAGDLAAATPHYRSALALRRQAGDEEMVQRGLFNLGRHHYRLGEFDAARDAFEELLVEARRKGDDGLASQGLFALATLFHLRGELDPAERALREVLELRRAAGQATATAAVERELGRLLVRRGELGEGRDLLAASLATFRAAGYPSGTAASLDGLGDALSRLGDDEGAQQRWIEAERIWRESGHRAAAARSAIAQARLAVLRGRLAEARGLLRPARAVLEEIGGSEGLHQALSVEGLLAHAERDLDGARRAHSAALELRHELGSTLGEMESLCDLAAVSLGQGLRAEAEALARTARDLAHRSGAADLALRGDLLLARSQILGGRAQAAGDLVNPWLAPERASDSPALRLETSLVAALVRGALGGPPEIAGLAAVETAAREAQRPALALEAGLARAAAEAAGGRRRAADLRRSALRLEARDAGYPGLLAQGELLSAAPPNPDYS